MKRIGFCFLFLLVISFTACEDDPVLEEFEQKEKGGGSYGKMSSEGMSKTDSTQNPEMF